MIFIKLFSKSKIEDNKESLKSKKYSSEEIFWLKEKFRNLKKIKK